MGWLRTRDSESSVTNIELFFDLIFVFAVTQVSHHLLGDEHPTWGSAGQSALLLAMLWTAWVYTTWITNWLDPDRDPLRFMLIGSMMCSLVVAAAIPHAFDKWGHVVGIAYAVMHIGRAAVAVALLRGEALQANYIRILTWCTLTGCLAVIGGFADGWWRIGLWTAAVVIDFLGGVVGFYVPFLGRSTSQGDWVTIDGHHFAERCQAFVLIALGESIVITGSSLATDLDEGHLDFSVVGAFGLTFVGAAALWWLYFDRAGEQGSRVAATTDDPGRISTVAYHWIHPIIVAGIIVTAAADELVFHEPTAQGVPAATWTILGGTALFITGHALYLGIVRGRIPVGHLVALVGVGVLAVVSSWVSVLTLAALVAAVVVGLCLWDRRVVNTSATPHLVL
ncbi:low temperature requirement protein A [Williamsia sterculiae]|uniref:Low temperature requirement protein LtrA n=1 Tax=Williamsia sterculiae TaxID=1344003 RepID=A0A1N7FJ35_9NOCA|nr:low temperature requirement protein A [Williamsia sterculiae]SIS00307.1 Low temperature requirement protein LtrA [Williamsia sterculiae]